MKKITVFALLASLFIGCTKDSSEVSPTQLTENAEIGLNVTPGGNPGTNPNNPSYNKAFVIANSDGSYSTNYGGIGLNFGTSFPYPTSVTPSQEGQLYVPSIGGVTNAQLISFEMLIDGSSFSAIYGTFQGTISPNGNQAITKYKEAFANYISGKTDPDTGELVQPGLPNFDTYASQYGFNAPSNGIITVTGRFIYDSNSPTNVSIVEATYKPAPSVAVDSVE